MRVTISYKLCVAFICFLGGIMYLYIVKTDYYSTTNAVHYFSGVTKAMKVKESPIAVARSVSTATLPTTNYSTTTHSTAVRFVHNSTQQILAQSDTATTEEIYKSEYTMRTRAAATLERCKSAQASRNFIGAIKAQGNQYLVTLNSTRYAYYPIAKCGWTTWTYVMFSAAGKPEEPNQKNFQIGWMSPFEHAGMKQSFVSFASVQKYKERLLFVRDPYDRLVSAYKNKILYGTYNINFKVPCRWLKEGMPAPTFPQFVKCIIQRLTGLQGLSLSKQVAAKRLDIHWTPQYWSALPCHSNYTLIGEFTHLEEDISTTISLLGLNATIPHENASKKRKNETLAYWYNQVPMEDKLILQKLYKLDFYILGFNSTIPS